LVRGGPVAVGGGKKPTAFTALGEKTKGKKKEKKKTSSGPMARKGTGLLKRGRKREKLVGGHERRRQFSFLSQFLGGSSITTGGKGKQQNLGGVIEGEGEYWGGGRSKNVRKT